MKEQVEILAEEVTIEDEEPSESIKDSIINMFAKLTPAPSMVEELLEEESYNKIEAFDLMVRPQQEQTDSTLSGSESRARTKVPAEDKARSSQELQAEL